MAHTITSYDQDLQRLEQLIIDMGRYGITQLQHAMLALERRQSEIAREVISGDRFEDSLEREVDELAVSMIALRQPTAKDLRHVTTAFKAAVHFERIGDYAANVAKRSLVLPKELDARWLLGIPRMGKWTLDMLREAVRAYESRDLELAVSTWRRDDMLDTLTAEFFVEAIEFMKTEGMPVEIGTNLMFIAKNLERIGDHVTNICELIHYRVSGEYLPHPRHGGAVPEAPPPEPPQAR